MTINEHVADPGTATKEFHLLAQSGNLQSPNESWSDSDCITKEFGVEFFKSIQWSADGTCMIANRSDNCISTYVIPPDLLEPRPEPHHLQRYTGIKCPEPVDAVTVYPGFDLQEPSSNLVLSAVNEHPIRLSSVLTTETVASYPLVSPTTEAYIKPKCLVFSYDGARFLCGSDSLLSTFDVSRPGQEPVSTFRTGPRNSKSIWPNPGASLKGNISALAIDLPYGVLAAGTLTRHIGLYDAGGQGECVGVFNVQGTAADEAIGGRGITQVIWSPCARYLYIVERKSDGVMFYDIRKTGQLLGWLEGRCASTNQRLHVDLESHGKNSAHTIWAGGSDGLVRSWEDPYANEGAVRPTEECKVHKDVVSGAVVHRSGGVLATASGQRRFDNALGDCSLKLWDFTR